MDYDKLIEQIRDYTKKSVKSKRYEHSERVADMCVTLCKKAGIDEKKGYLVGIGHDMCKDMPDYELIGTAGRDGNPVTEYELGKPALLHGRAAAVLMKDKFGITDSDILEAVANHTSGKEGMCDLTKILFLADKIEPGRPQSSDEYRARLLAMPLEEMTGTVIVENYKYIKSRGHNIYPGTQKMVEYYLKMMGEGDLL
ncbi:MAG: bis(5'-nucleosyl)-tetraphosphatase (symmetrical) YqeK [Treponema sp.]|nr:bis(5'-nucleosyl)-tetraphosphatase (symmetrical) YqeK [Treponema sp.]